MRLIIASVVSTPPDILFFNKFRFIVARMYVHQKNENRKTKEILHCR